MVAPGKQATLSPARDLPAVPAIRIGNVVLTVYSLLFYLFIYGPILILIVYSFNASRFPTRWAGFSLEWYEKLFQNRAMGQALRNSLIVSFGSTVTLPTSATWPVFSGMAPLQFTIGWSDVNGPAQNGADTEYRVDARDPLGTRIEVRARRH